MLMLKEREEERWGGGARITKLMGASGSPPPLRLICINSLAHLTGRDPLSTQRERETKLALSSGRVGGGGRRDSSDDYDAEGGEDQNVQDVPEKKLLLVVRSPSHFIIIVVIPIC